MGWHGDGTVCLSRNRGTLSLRRSLITNSYLYDLLLFVQSPLPPPSLFIPHKIPTKGESRDQSHPWPWGKDSLSLSLFILGRITNLFFMPLNKTRLTYLWLLPLNFASLCPSFSFLFSFPSLFLSSIVHVDSFHFFVPSISQSLSLRIYVSIRVGVCTCPSSLLRDCPRSRRNEHPFWDLSRPRRGYFTLPRGLGMNSNSFRVLVSLCSRCFEEEDRFFPWRTR